MIKPGDSPMTKKTMHELAKEFPEKTYRELEKYRDADRQQEARRIITQQENEELKDNQLKENWKDKYDLEHRLRQEAEGELTIIKGIGNTSPEIKSLRSEVAALKQQLYTERDDHQKNLDRVKKENNDLHNKVAALLDAVDPAVTIKKARESGL